MYPVCIDCEAEMIVEYNGIQLLTMDNSSIPSALYASDVYKCRICNKRIAISNPTPAVHYKQACIAYLKTDPTRRFIIRRHDQMRIKLPKEITHANQTPDPATAGTKD
jgi:hypothetical protein